MDAPFNKNINAPYIAHTLEILSLLPIEKGQEIAAFADEIYKKFASENLVKDMQVLMSHAASFDFLNKEEDLYTENDVIEKF